MIVVAAYLAVTTLAMIGFGLIAREFERAIAPPRGNAALPQPPLRLCALLLRWLAAAKKFMPSVRLLVLLSANRLRLKSLVRRGVWAVAMNRGCGRCAIKL